MVHVQAGVFAFDKQDRTGTSVPEMSLLLGNRPFYEANEVIIDDGQNTEYTVRSGIVSNGLANITVAYINSKIQLIGGILVHLFVYLQAADILGQCLVGSIINTNQDI